MCSQGDLQTQSGKHLNSHVLQLLGQTSSYPLETSGAAAGTWPSEQVLEVEKLEKVSRTTCQDSPVYSNANENSYLRNENYNKAFHHILLQFTTYLPMLISIFSVTDCLQLLRPPMYKPVDISEDGVWEEGLIL